MSSFSFILARLVILKLVLLPCCMVMAQNGYNILYIFQYRDKSQNLLPKPFNYSRLVFNDSFIYTYVYREGEKDPADQNEFPSKKKIHDILQKRYSTTYYFKGPKRKKEYWYYNRLELKIPVWIISDEEKIIQGYKCRKAYWLNEYFYPSKDSIKTWKTDSTIAWVTKEIQPATSFWNYPGLPGTVMEIYDHNRQGWYCKAIEVKKINVFIRFPTLDMIRPYKDPKPKW